MPLPTLLLNRLAVTPLLDWIFLAVAGAIAWHGLTWRDEEGERDWVRLLFGCIALMFALRVLLVDVLGLDIFLG